ncbi:MAG: DUF6132 family protein [Candidatus Omnitrophota bacterium]
MKIALGIIIGACIGYALGFWGRCSSGVCPLTSNPYISSVIGALLGAILMMHKR